MDPHAKKLYVYTHKGFVFEYNGNQVIMNISFMLSLQLTIMYIQQIISISLKHGNPVELKHGLSSLTFTYSVTWNPTDVLFENRFERLLEADFFEHKVSSSICDLGYCADHIQVHWLSIFSSFMMVLFLTGLVSVILLRTVKRDFTRYDREEGLADFVSKTFIIYVKSNAFLFFFLGQRFR